ncbi:phosphonate transport system permease protein [Cyclobacterium xiamenense]|uniref:Phosphonate transport system permease protein n=1 Tax=Cyclobacterium xiamenense TaxID=1297121 RepID=A0A1H6THY5_9BACT|nr:phosphonate ABC transporter, permease protein PhnE [Cyclobacterium xiamenense]SEI79683.1 phosphonate transport system permease protein [Cyclobacterium xiamenense]
MDTAGYRKFKLRKQWRRLWPFFILFPFLIFSAWLVEVDMRVFEQKNFRILNLLSDFLYPAWEVLPVMLIAASKTVLLAILGTVFGSILSFFFAVYAAENLSPRWANHISRILIALERSISEVLIILVLIVIFGLGMFPGVVAIAISCIGMLGKLYADAIEEIPESTIQGLRSVGATKLQVILFGVFPEIATSLIANTILRFEINVRTSVLLGAIGAGGIGYELLKAYNYLAYSEMSVAILTILALVFASEQLSGYWRKSVDGKKTFRNAF